MTFKDIIKKMNIKNELISNNSKHEIKNIVLSDKQCDENIIFTAIKGFKTDGHNFIKNAYLNGCRNFVVENSDFLFDELKKDSTVIKVGDSRTALAEISCIINDYPFNKLKVIGITGTKGKTTVSTLIYKFLKTGFKASLFTTVKNIVADKEEYAERTTVEANQAQALLKRSADNKDDFAIVEVSSHGVTLKRIYGIQWDIGVFTSFSQDHLDLYGTMDKYFEAKLDFFKSINNSTKKNKIAFINIDDEKGKEVCKVLNDSVSIVKVGQSDEADYKIYDFKNDGAYTLFKIKKGRAVYEIKTKMKGFFNVINITLAISVCLESGISFKNIQEVLIDCKGVEGRFEIIVESPFTVIVDYAHSPDSLQKILEELNKIKVNKLITVFGCTGERDKEKRPIMGDISARLSDYTIITNDDTYGECPEEIAGAIEFGFKKNNKVICTDYEIILDRKTAIKKALEIAGKKDIILIAGMGHQKYQYLQDGAVNHNDKDYVLELLK